jgi:hypothetical protein
MCISKWVHTSDNSYIVAGFTEAYLDDGDVKGHHWGADWHDYWVVKIDSLGKLIWQKCLGGSSDDRRGASSR